MKYRLRVNSNEYFVASSQELKQLLDFATGQVFADLELTQIHDPERKPKLITRLLAPIMKLDLSLVNVEDEIIALINGNLAVLSYFERRGDMLHSVSSDDTGPEDSMVYFYSSSGDQIERPRKWSIPTEKAIDALLRFYEDGKQPHNIQWAKYDDDVEWTDTPPNA